MTKQEALYSVGIGLRAAAAVYRRGIEPGPSAERNRPIDLFLCIADHFEPQWGNAPQELARKRLEDWLARYPGIARRHRDADGRHPAHTFFYPYDEYNEWEFCHLSQMCAAGWGEIELHLHHHDDTSDTLRNKLRHALRLYREHGALSAWPNGTAAFGFVHGNWALDNSRCENGRNFCGVNNELTVLADQGCYADFTFPAWQNLAQPRQVNSIYYAVDDPEQPKSYDYGQPVRTGIPCSGTLMIVQGPLVPGIFPTRKMRRWGRRPGIDDGDLAASPDRRYTPRRFDRWVRAGIRVAGCPNRVFIKLHCHGAADKNRAALLDEDLEALFTDAEARYNDGKQYRLHYVTAREMFNIIKATEAEANDDPNAARDFLLPSPYRAAAAPASRSVARLSEAPLESVPA